MKNDHPRKRSPIGNSDFYDNDSFELGRFNIQRHEGDADLIRHDPPRTKRQWPYAYDPFTIWGEASTHKECNASDYTDRLEEWDYNKYHRLVEEIYRVNGEFLRPFSEHHCRGDLIEKFLQRYHDNAGIKLLRVIEYCNASTGYTTYRLDYVSPPKEA